MSNMNQIASDLYKAITEADSRKPQPYDTKAEVQRIEGNTVWVKIPGGNDETPVQRTNNANAGDTVMVRVSGGRAWLLGNNTSPATDDAMANQAYTVGKEAGEVADVAIKNAIKAQEAADTADGMANLARQSATIADKSANDAIGFANTAGRAASLAQAAAEAAQGDIDEQKEWFWHDTNGSHILGANSGYRNDIDSSGMRIIDSVTQEPVTQFAVNDVRVGSARENNIHITNTRFELINEGVAVAYLEGERFKSGDAQITNLYMKTYTTNNEEVGALGFVMRSNGHLSIRRLR